MTSTDTRDGVRRDLIDMPAGYDRVEAIAALLDDHDRYMVMYQSPLAEIASPHHLPEGSTATWADAPGRIAAAAIADGCLSKGRGVVVVYDATHAPALRPVVDLSAFTHPMRHPARAPYGPPHCDLCAAYAAARLVWARAAR